ncbi:MAG: type 4a pilus biogenesis protein PilO [Candidatus Methylomirabilales bacterium]
MGFSRRDLLILGVLGGVATVLYFLLLLPIAGERAHLTAEVNRLSKETEKIQKMVTAFQSGKEGLENVQARMKKIRSRLLPAGSVSQLLGQISRPSKQLEVRIVSFSPKDPDPAQHNQVLCDLVLEGTYLQLGRYLEAVTQGSYLLAVNTLRLDSEEPGSPHLRMNLTLKTWMKES